MSKFVSQENLDEFATKLNTKQKTIFATKSEVGSPLIATTAASMTDTTRVYVYVGSESGYTNGSWYYYNGSAWTMGGVYNSTALQTDTTLSVPNMAADAKVTGDCIEELTRHVTNINKNVYNLTSDILNLGYLDSGGASHPSTTVVYTDYIPVSLNEQFTYKLSNSSVGVPVIAFYSTKAENSYNSQYSLIGTGNAGFLEGTFSVGQNGYIRIVYRINQVNDVYVVFNSDIPTNVSNKIQETFTPLEKELTDLADTQKCILYENPQIDTTSSGSVTESIDIEPSKLKLTVGSLSVSPSTGQDYSRVIFRKNSVLVASVAVYHRNETQTYDVELTDRVTKIEFCAKNDVAGSSGYQGIYSNVKLEQLTGLDIRISEIEKDISVIHSDISTVESNLNDFEGFVDYLLSTDVKLPTPDYAFVRYTETPYFIEAQDNYSPSISPWSSVVSRDRIWYTGQTVAVSGGLNGSESLGNAGPLFTAQRFEDFNPDITKAYVYTGETIPDSIYEQNYYYSHANGEWLKKERYNFIPNVVEDHIYYYTPKSPGGDTQTFYIWQDVGLYRSSGEEIGSQRAYVYVWTSNIPKAVRSFTSADGVTFASIACYSKKNISTDPHYTPMSNSDMSAWADLSRKTVYYNGSVSNRYQVLYIGETIENIVIQNHKYSSTDGSTWEDEGLANYLMGNSVQSVGLTPDGVWYETTIPKECKLLAITTHKPETYGGNTYTDNIRVQFMGVSSGGGSGTLPDEILIDETLNPYENIPFRMGEGTGDGQYQTVRTTTHDHCRNPEEWSALSSAELDVYAISNYYPSYPTYPLGNDNPYLHKTAEDGGQPNNLTHRPFGTGTAVNVQIPNTELSNAVGTPGNMHFNSVGSLFESGVGQENNVSFDSETSGSNMNNYPWNDHSKHIRYIGGTTINYDIVEASSTTPSTSNWDTSKRVLYYGKASGSILDGHVYAYSNGSWVDKGYTLIKNHIYYFDSDNTNLWVDQGVAKEAPGGGTTSWASFVTQIKRDLLIPDGGGITINHPGYRGSSSDQIISADTINALLDTDKSTVLGIEIFNGNSQGRNSINLPPDGTWALDQWDQVLSTGRRCWGFAVPDHRAQDGSMWLGSIKTYVPIKSASETLRAIRQGKFYAQLKREKYLDWNTSGDFSGQYADIKITNITATNQQVIIETNLPAQIVAYTNNYNEIGEDNSTIGTSLAMNIDSSDVYVRFEITTWYDKVTSSSKSVWENDWKHVYLYTGSSSGGLLHNHTYQYKYSNGSAQWVDIGDITEVEIPQFKSLVAKYWDTQTVNDLSWDTSQRILYRGVPTSSFMYNHIYEYIDNQWQTVRGTDYGNGQICYGDSDIEHTPGDMLFTNPIMFKQRKVLAAIES